MIASFRSALSLLTIKHKIIYFGLVALRIGTNLLDVIGLAAVGLLGALLASGLTGRTEAIFLSFSLPIESSSIFLWVISAVALLFISKSLLATALLRITTIFLSRLEGRLSAEIANYLFSGGLARLKAFSRGDIQWAVSTSAQQGTTGVLSSSSAIITEGSLFLFVFALFVFVDPTTALLISAYFIMLVGLFQISINQRLKRLGSRIEASTVGYVNALNDLLAGFREISVANKLNTFLDKFSTHRQQFARDHALQSFVMGLPRFFVESSLMIGVLALVGYQFARGALSDGIVTTAVFLIGGVRMMAALLPMQNAVANLKIYSPQAARALALLREARAVAYAGDKHRSTSLLKGSPLPTGGIEVAIEDLSFMHQDASEKVLDSISLNIFPGLFVALVGPSGSGKTTIADLIMGLYRPTDGNVLLDGLEPAQKITSEPGAIAYVPQSPGMLSGTIAENVALGYAPEEIDEKRVWECLRQAQIDSFVSELPKGIWSPLGKQADSLSGGQKQRMGLARALYTRPRLVVLDEATSALDASTEADISQAIEALRPNTTVIVIAHRLSSVQKADQVVVVESGKISASGTFSEVRSRVPIIERYVQLMNIGSDGSSREKRTAEDL